MERIHEIDYRRLSAMTDEEIQKLLKIEMMVHGVNRPVQPKQIPEKPVITATPIARGEAYSSVVIADHKIYSVGYDYNDGDYIYYKNQKANAERVVNVYEKEDAIAYQKALNKWADGKKEITEWNKTVDAQNRRYTWLVNKVYSIVREAQGMAYEYESFDRKRNEFITLAEGDETIANKFLEQMYGNSFCSKAFAWLETETSFLCDEIKKIPEVDNENV